MSGAEALWPAIHAVSLVFVGLGVLTLSGRLRRNALVGVRMSGAMTRCWSAGVQDHVRDQVVQLPYVDALAELHLDVARAGPHFQLGVPIEGARVL